MKKLTALLFIAAFALTGCAGVEVYTFQKDRVDQKIKGNQGYLQGESKEAPVTRTDSKRTLIGVDIDVSGMFPGGSDNGEPVKRKESVPQKTRIIYEKEPVREEDEWIK